MDIGKKLQEARTKVNLTQEQVAEALAVSRQTISNWENEKTYPDIKSVVVLSDLYNISLDNLLKDSEKSSSTNYLNYLEESTNTVKSKTKLSKIILVIAYLIIWAFTILTFWLSSGSSDLVGHIIIFFWIILPVTMFVISLLIGLHNYWNKCKWFSPVIFGIMHMLSEYGTTSLGNMIEFDKLNAPDPGAFIIGFFISLIGLALGYVIYLKRVKRL